LGNEQEKYIYGDNSYKLCKYLGTRTDGIIQVSTTTGTTGVTFIAGQTIAPAGAEELLTVQWLVGNENYINWYIIAQGENLVTIK
jgi:hypothetical protein